MSLYSRVGRAGATGNHDRGGNDDHHSSNDPDSNCAIRMPASALSPYGHAARMPAARFAYTGDRVFAILAKLGDAALEQALHQANLALDLPQVGYNFSTFFKF